MLSSASARGLLVAALLLGGCALRGESNRLFELRPGDCFSDRLLDADDASLILRVRIVPCDQPHQKEVTAVVPVDDASERPDADVFADIIANECTAALADYAGDAADGLSATGHFPSTNSWRLGYRWVICVAAPADGGLVDSSVRQEPMPTG